jgi:hypothetical protein
MKSIVSVALIGGVISVAAALLPGDAGQAWARSRRSRQAFS